MKKMYWYHSGSNSFDNPEIKQFERNQEPSWFGFGPFDSFAEAKGDFVAMLKSDILNLKYQLENVRKLKRGASD